VEVRFHTNEDEVAWNLGPQVRAFADQPYEEPELNIEKTSTKRPAADQPPLRSKRLRRPPIRFPLNERM
jgi:hypothetical protein